MLAGQRVVYPLPDRRGDVGPEEQEPTDRNHCDEQTLRDGGEVVHGKR
jgi:hypothetical protein